MKFQLAAIAGLLLPMAALAIPAAEAAAEPAPITESIDVPLDVETRDISPEALGLEKRANVVCSIVNSSSSSVKCRSGPGFDYGVIASVTPGKNYQFNCYKSGDCYNNNCTWQRISWDGKNCYVNGYYTSSKCTVAALGKC
ncbi:hypothetical protein BDW59DRAFT_161215 [Aspergillus cavernicola]|uniref:SH3 domain-containing protein n=1 Tax=Aspergillus cavernicola TaxID=176166 RepID=A0ABR4IED4_9EURO